MKTYKVTYSDVKWPGHNKVFCTNNYGRAKQVYDERSKELKRYGYDIEKSINLEELEIEA